MQDQIHQILLAAVSAARYGAPPDLSIVQAIVDGDRGLRIDELKFDSLAWMEFCISIELQSGQELTPVMHYVFQIEEWLRARVHCCSNTCS